MSTKKIALNYYLNTRPDAEGTLRLFGKCGFQTMSDKTDRYTMANLSAIERALSAGELTDLDGNPVTDGAVIQVFARVSVVKGNDEIEGIASIRTAAGADVAIPEATAAATSDDPF